MSPVAPLPSGSAPAAPVAIAPADSASISAAAPPAPAPAESSAAPDHPALPPPKSKSASTHSEHHTESAKPKPASASNAPAEAGGPKTFACGDKGQPPCPLQRWMKSTMGAAAASGDGEALAKALDEAAAHAPPGFSGWAGIARGGAAKARGGDLDGAKASCKSCHDQYKAKYKAEMRDRPF